MKAFFFIFTKIKCTHNSKILMLKLKLYLNLLFGQLKAEHLSFRADQLICSIPNMWIVADIILIVENPTKSIDLINNELVIK